MASLKDSGTAKRPGNELVGTNAQGLIICLDRGLSRIWGLRGLTPYHLRYPIVYLRIAFAMNGRGCLASYVLIADRHRGLSLRLMGT